MGTPTYLAVKVGDQYELRRIDPQYQMKMASITAAGALLTALGFTHRTLAGFGLGLAGAGLIYFGLSGRNPVKDLQATRGLLRAGRGPSHQHDAKVASSQRPQDLVDEAAMESFPASDPPALGKETKKKSRRRSKRT